MAVIAAVIDLLPQLFTQCSRYLLIAADIHLTKQLFTYFNGIAYTYSSYLMQQPYVLLIALLILHRGGVSYLVQLRIIVVPMQCHSSIIDLAIELYYGEMLFSTNYPQP